MWSRIDLKQHAKSDFHCDYWGYVIVSLIASLSIGDLAFKVKEVSFANFDLHSIYYINSSGAIAMLLALLVFSPLYIGTRRFFLSNLYKEDGKTEIGVVLYAFQNNYGNVVLICFLKKLFLILWSMLLVIPGIVKFYSYFMVDYILAENPGIEQSRAFEISKRTMQGEKMNTFVLHLSFIPWFILVGITAGIAGIFYVGPYVEGTMARLYDTLKEKSIREGIATYDDYNC